MKKRGMNFSLGVFAIALILFSQFAFADDVVIRDGTLNVSNSLLVDNSDHPTYKGWLDFTGGSLTLKEQNAATENYPYIQWLDSANTRSAFLGWGSKNAPKHLQLQLENGHNLYIDGGNVGIGTSSPGIYANGFGGKSLHISNAGAAGIRLSDTVSSTSEEIYVNQDGLNFDHMNNRDFIFRGMGKFLLNISGNVGIGTINPVYKLEVATADYNTAGVVASYSGHYAGIGVEAYAANWGTGIFQDGSMAANFEQGGLALGNYVGSNVPANSLILSGSAGIGTTLPSTKLHVKNPTGNSIVSMDSGDGATPRFSAVDFYDDGAAKWGLGKDTSGNFYIDQYAVANVITILASNRNIGIGTASPGAKLHIQGVITDSDTGPLLSIKGYNNEAQTTIFEAIDENSQTDVFFKGAPTEGGTPINYFRGNVGIRTINPGHELEVGGNTLMNALLINHLNSGLINLGYSSISSSADAGNPYPFNENGNLILQSRNNAARDILFVTSADGSTQSYRMIINRNGNVGIGTTSPGSDKLSVSGNIKATGDICTDAGGGKCLSTVSAGGGGGSTQLVSGARGYLNAQQVIPAYTPTKVNFNAETYDVQSEFDISNGRFTAKSPGYYLVIGEAAYLGTAVGSRDIAYIYKNGAQNAFSINSNAAGSDTTAHAWDIIYLNTGDYVELYTSHERPSPPSATLSGDGRDNYLSVARLDGVSGGNQWLNGTGGAVYYNSGNVGIGTTSPGTSLDVQAATSAVTIRSTTGTNTASLSIYNNGYTYIGRERSAGGNFFTGSLPYASIFGSADGYPVQFATSGNVRMTIDNSGNVGIGTATIPEKLTVNGNVQAVAYYYSSDINLKKDIQAVNGLNIINQLDGVLFRWKENNEQSAGLIAQDVEKALPQAVKTDNSTGVKSVNYAALTAPIVESIKELDQKNKEEDKKIQELENEIEKLKIEINDLRSGAEK